MTRRKTLFVLLVIAGVLGGLLAWRLVGAAAPPEVGEQTREAMRLAARIKADDPQLAAYLAANGADSLTEKELAELILQFQREREAANPVPEQGSAREPVDD